MKINTKAYKLIIPTALLYLVSCILYPALAHADPIADPNDIFNVNQPTANQKVAGTINISWRMFDNEQSSIPYTIQLFDAATCKDANYGSINSSSTGMSNSSQDNVVAWNTNTTLINSNIQDGKYCVKVCAAMKYGSTPYSTCNSRIVTIINHNSLPTITSTPPTLTVKESGSWQYQVKAVDADGDPLRYFFVYGTNFLDINSQTGLITTNSNSKALPAGVAQADYRIVIGVDDGMSGTTTQEFTLSVIRDQPLPAPTPQPQPSPAPQPSPQPTPQPQPAPTPQPNPNPQPTNTPSTIEIKSPDDTSTFSGTNNQISWSASDAEGITEITLSYSTDGNTWTVITKPDVAATTYNWDVSGLKDGSYYVQVSVKDKQGSVTTKTSKKFQINNSQNPNNPATPIIVNINPSDGQTISVNQPTISGDLVPPNGATIDTSSFDILVDSTDIKSKCTVDDKSFTCTLSSPLSDGKHKINISISDSNKKTGTSETTFTINTVPVSSPDANTVVLFGQAFQRNLLVFIIFICCLCSILLLIPWILYSLWTGRQHHDQTDTSTAENTTTTTTQTQYDPTLDTSNLNSYSQMYPYNKESYVQPQPEVGAPLVDYSNTVPTGTVTTNYYNPETTYAQTQPAVSDYNPNYIPDSGTATTTQTLETNTQPLPYDTTTAPLATDPNNPYASYNFPDPGTTATSTSTGFVEPPTTD